MAVDVSVCGQGTGGRGSILMCVLWRLLLGGTMVNLLVNVRLCSTVGFLNCSGWVRAVILL